MLNNDKDITTNSWKDKQQEWQWLRNCVEIHLKEWGMKAEIEMLKSANDENFRQWDMLAEKTKQHYADLYNEAKDTLKAEAYKEYHIKAKSCLKANRDVEQQIGNNYVVKRIKEIENRFDNILKEMVREEERI